MLTWKITELIQDPTEPAFIIREGGRRVVASVGDVLTLGDSLISRSATIWLHELVGDALRCRVALAANTQIVLFDEDFDATRRVGVLEVVTGSILSLPVASGDGDGDGDGAEPQPITEEPKPTTTDPGPTTDFHRKMGAGCSPSDFMQMVRALPDGSACVYSLEQALTIYGHRGEEHIEHFLVGVLPAGQKAILKELVSGAEPVYLFQLLGALEAEDWKLVDRFALTNAKVAVLA